MKHYSGYDYMLIDVANQYGLDKKLFEERIEWTKHNIRNLEAMAVDAENKPLYKKAVMALRRAQRHEPIGHAVALDACCSGIQVMSALTGCETGASNTGLINTGRREDAYSTLTDVMNELLSEDEPIDLGNGVIVPRKQAKMALMTSFYGSKAEPKKIFGAESEALEAFYRAAAMIAPGAWDLLQVLLKSWRPYALVHEWQLPDGFEARVKVMVDKEATIEVDELDHATFTYAYKVNEGTDRGLSNIANVVHSVDAYVLRNMVRRCNYDEYTAICARNHIRSEMHARAAGKSEELVEPVSDKVNYYVDLYQKTGMADPVILPYLQGQQCQFLSDAHLDSLMRICESMLAHDPFPILTIHDSFAAHPNNLNHLRQHYIDIFAELAESKVLESILNQLYNQQGSYTKLSETLGEKIRESEYALS